jgi:hypothetical protein
MCNSQTHWLRSWLQVGAFCLIIGCFDGFAQDAVPQKVNDAPAGSQKQAGSETAQKPAEQPVVSPYSGLTIPQVEEYLLKAKVIRLKNLPIGVTNTQRATLDDGKLEHDAHVQTVEISKPSFQTLKGTELGFRDSYKFNMAAYELAKLLDLDMVPPSVERKVGGNGAAVTWWINDTMMETDRLKQKIQPPDLTRWNRQARVRQVFDQLIYNTDRNQQNILITKDWNIWLIDHTRAFRTMKTLQNPKDLIQCDRKLLAKLRELNKAALKEKLGHYVTDTQIEAMLIRRDLIVKFFDEQVAQKGESEMIFDLERNTH